MGIMSGRLKRLTLVLSISVLLGGYIAAIRWISPVMVFAPFLVVLVVVLIVLLFTIGHWIWTGEVL